MIHSIKVGNTTENISVKMAVAGRSNPGDTDFAITKYVPGPPPPVSDPFIDYPQCTIMVTDDDLGTNVLSVFSVGNTRYSGVRIGELSGMVNNTDDAVVSVMMQDGNNMDITMYGSDSITFYRGGANNGQYYDSVMENLGELSGSVWRIGTYDYDKSDLELLTYGYNKILLNSGSNIELTAATNDTKGQIQMTAHKFAFYGTTTSRPFIEYFDQQKLTIENGVSNYIYITQLAYEEDRISIVSPHVFIGMADSNHQDIHIYSSARMDIDGSQYGVRISGRAGNNTRNTANAYGTILSGKVIAITGTLTAQMFSSTGIIRGLEGTVSTFAVPSMCIVGPGYGYLSPSYTYYDDTQFMIVTGVSTSSRKNALRIAKNKVFLNQALSSSGAGLTEVFEWLDGNENNEDRVGHFVTLVGEKIRYAEPSDDYVLGAVDPLPLLIGDDDEVWKGMHKKDVFGRVITERIFVPAEMDEEGNLLWEDHYEDIPVTGEDFVPDTKYISRSARKEYSTISSKGKVVLIDDGTCIVDKFATVGPGGIATHSDDNVAVRVMKRIDDTHIKVFIDASFLIKH